jgi:hypothetical protein
MNPPTFHTISRAGDGQCSNHTQMDQQHLVTYVNLTIPLHNVRTVLYTSAFYWNNIIFAPSYSKLAPSFNFSASLIQWLPIPSLAPLSIASFISLWSIAPSIHRSFDFSLIHRYFDCSLLHRSFDCSLNHCSFDCSLTHRLHPSIAPLTVFLDPSLVPFMFLRLLPQLLHAPTIDPSIPPWPIDYSLNNSSLNHRLLPDTMDGRGYQWIAIIIAIIMAINSSHTIQSQFFITLDTCEWLNNKQTH